ncbi:endonuclease [Antarcticibacterium flavum]|uniref:Endonuclease n=1 Tax=Antarcticibacterium flavum TaxID=2058175 RepID=A0A5B7X688_9FLAO|nr:MULTISPECIES: endonuclease/exonuclease/phosphatase family protein [Antarcticibacterium]MCM4159316.1 endonuclease [Antarcticibacterium sp. W02-3]QCY70976.1 endonuclease [Antarcticibacterium flavum]
MKGLKLLDKLLFIFNSLLAFALLLAYLLPHIPPKSFPFISVLSLGVPLLILGNLIFLLFWAVRLKRQFLLPLFVLILGYNHILSWIQFSGTGENSDEDLKVMSYNVRMFNAYKWVDDDDIPQKITSFIQEKDPDVLVTQEHYVGVAGLRKIYPYSFIKLKENGSEFGSAIFSKYPIVNEHSLDFPQRGNNNAIYVDIVKNEDTLRVYNVHFQSLNIKPEIHELQNEDSKKLVGRIGSGFKEQQIQAEILLHDINDSPYKNIILGDFNNTAFSYIYRTIKGEKYQDAFRESGSGFSQTFNINYFPLRIDFLLIDREIKVNTYEVFRIKYSDHFPIMASIAW